jgi:hypothetical protein
VPAEEFGRAVHGDVRAEGDRLLQQRGGEGVIDRDQRAPSPCCRAQGRQVGDVEQRVGGRFQPHQIRAAGRSCGGGGVGDVDQVDVPASVLLAVCQQGVNTGIAIRRCHHPGARGQQVQDRRRRAHSRTERNSFAALQFADHLLKRLPSGRGIVAGVLPAPGLAPVASPEVRRQDDGHIQRLARLIGGPPGCDQDRLGPPGWPRGC